MFQDKQDKILLCIYFSLSGKTYPIKNIKYLREIGPIQVPMYSQKIRPLKARKSESRPSCKV